MGSCRKVVFAALAVAAAFAADADVPADGCRSAGLSVSRRNPRYFEVGGKSFIPIGINLCYCRDRDPKQGYLEWLDKFAANGGNYIRLWCGNVYWDVMPKFGEIDPKVVGRLKWMADECQKRGIKIKLCLEQFRGFDESQPGVFRKEIYALACVIGGIFYWVCHEFLGFNYVWSGIICAGAVIIMRLLAVRFHLHLPTLKGED